MTLQPEMLQLLLNNRTLEFDLDRAGETRIRFELTYTRWLLTISGAVHLNVKLVGYEGVDIYINNNSS